MNKEFSHSPEEAPPPTPLAQWENDASSHPNLVWWNRLDGRYQIEVQRTDSYRANFVIFDKEKDNTILSNEPVGLSYGAIFGPDVDDVYTWQERAIKIVDNLIQTPQKKSENQFSLFGYDETLQPLAERLTTILEKGNIAVFTEATDTYTPLLCAYVSGVTTKEEMSEFKKWMAGDETPPEDTLVRLGIAVDFAHEIKNLYQTENNGIAQSLFMGMKPQFNDRAMATALQVVAPEDLGKVHGAFQEIVNADASGTFYSAQSIYPGLEKYFLSSEKERGK